MDRGPIIRRFLQDVVTQNADALKQYFSAGARVRWHNTNEQFTADEYILVNCEYPGNWRGEVERIEHCGNTSVSVARVWSPDDGVSFHVTSFFDFCDGKIRTLGEYWSEDGGAPQWRVGKHIGTPIK